MVRQNMVIALSIAFIGIFAVFLAVGPRVAQSDQDKWVVKNVYLPGPFGLSINGDSGEFLRIAHDPTRLLEKNSERQSRPGMPFVAYLISRPLMPLSNIEDYLPITFKHERSERFRGFVQYIPEFIAYLILNAALLLGSIWLLSLTWSLPSPSVALVFVAWLLVANDTVKAFFWSPHTQMFNIFTPVFILYLAVRSWRKDFFFGREILWIMFFAGLGMTAYATFALSLPVLFVISYIKYKSNFSKLLFRYLLICLIFITPMLLWTGFVYLVNGTFYHHEVTSYNQVVWIFDQNFLGTIKLLWIHFYSIIIGFIKLNPILILTGIFLSIFIYIKNTSDPSINPIIVISLFIALMLAVFFSFVGYYPDRLINTIFPMAVAILGVLIKTLLNIYPNHARQISLASGFLIGLWCIFIIVKDGPYS